MRLKPFSVLSLVHGRLGGDWSDTPLADCNRDAQTLFSRKRPNSYHLGPIESGEALYSCSGKSQCRMTEVYRFRPLARASCLGSLYLVMQFGTARAHSVAPVSRLLVIQQRLPLCASYLLPPPPSSSPPPGPDQVSCRSASYTMAASSTHPHPSAS